MTVPTIKHLRDDSNALTMIRGQALAAGSAKQALASGSAKHAIQRHRHGHSLQTYDDSNALTMIQPCTCDLVALVRVCRVSESHTLYKTSTVIEDHYYTTILLLL